MRLLLDEMWPGSVATQLRTRGHDVAAVVERPELRGRADVFIFDTAQAEQRAIVTENVADYRLLLVQLAHDHREHAGVVFTSNRRYPRHDPRTLGRLVTALGDLLERRVELRNSEYWLP